MGDGSVCWQHNELPLCYSMWADNNIVKTPDRVDGGLNRKRKVDGKKERDKTAVPCLIQQINYSETFHLINKGNGTEALYALGGKSGTNGWSPELHWCYVNMGCNNDNVMYQTLCGMHQPDRKILDRRGGLKELAHAWSQRGEPMRKYKVEHATPCYVL